MKFLCYIGIHKYLFKGLRYYYDCSYGVEALSTAVVWRCSRCSKVKQEHHYGEQHYKEDYESNKRVD